jgi:hypothetical protein
VVVTFVARRFAWRTVDGVGHDHAAGFADARAEEALLDAVLGPRGGERTGSCATGDRTPSTRGGEARIGRSAVIHGARAALDV